MDDTKRSETEEAIDATEKKDEECDVKDVIHVMCSKSPTKHTSLINMIHKSAMVSKNKDTLRYNR